MNKVSNHCETTILDYLHHYSTRLSAASNYFVNRTNIKSEHTVKVNSNLDAKFVLAI